VAVYELLERPDLDAPLLVVSLEGWIDAGLAAATAMERILDHGDWVTVAEFDADELLDHRAHRPILHLDEGVVTEFRWPRIDLRAGTDAEGRDVLVLVGAEPDHRWRAFSDGVVELALELGVRQVHGLGAYPAPVAHTRSPRVVATASSAELANQIGTAPGRIDVPGGVSAAIEQLATERGIPAAGLWAQVPHYAAAMPYPAAALALLESLERVAGVRFDAVDLREEAQATRARLDGLIAGNPEHEAMVRQLEAQADAEPAPEDPAFYMSGDELAAELEEFLRDEGP
jgi:proteasome assembly chaperone (PAC2) family protein